MTFKELFHECYVIEYGLGEGTVNVTEYRLIKRYWDKVTDRLKVKHAELRALGEKLGNDKIAEILYRPSPLLAAITKSTIWNSTSVISVGTFSESNQEE